MGRRALLVEAKNKFELPPTINTGARIKIIGKTKKQISANMAFQVYPLPPTSADRSLSANAPTVKFIGSAWVSDSLYPDTEINNNIYLAGELFVVILNIDDATEEGWGMRSMLYVRDGSLDAGEPALELPLVGSSANQFKQTYWNELVLFVDDDPIDKTCQVQDPNTGLMRYFFKISGEEIVQI